MCVVSSLTTESEQLVIHRGDVVRNIQAHKKYHQYMSRVLESAGDFHEISEIMSRYQTLLATYEVYIYTRALTVQRYFRFFSRPRLCYSVVSVCRLSVCNVPNRKMAHGESNGHVTEYKNGMDKYYKWTGVYSGGGVYASIRRYTNFWYCHNK